MTIKDHVKGVSTFQSYRAGYFYYKTDTDLEFTVPLEDIDGATLNAQEKSVFFMRWIRKHLNQSLDSSVEG